MRRNRGSSECSVQSPCVLFVDSAFADGLLDAIPPLDQLPPIVSVPPSQMIKAGMAVSEEDSEEYDESSSKYEAVPVQCPECSSEQDANRLKRGTYCRSCNEILRSRPNATGVRFHIGQAIYFIAKCGPPFPGRVVRFPDEESVEVKYKESAWKGDAFNEIKPLNDVAITLEELVPKGRRRNRGQKFERFSDVQLTLRDGEKEPCPRCKTALPLKSVICSKCNCIVRTKVLPSGDRLVVGQNVYFRNKLGDMAAGTVVKLLHGDLVEIQYKDPQWRYDMYNENRPLSEVALTLDDLLTQVGSRKRSAPVDFGEATMQHEREYQRIKQERARELSEIREKEAARVAEIERKEREKAKREEARASSKAQIRLKKQKEREKAREKKRLLKAIEKERLKKMNHDQRNRVRRLTKGSRVRKERKDRQQLWRHEVLFVNNHVRNDPGVGRSNKLDAQTAAENFQRVLRIAKEQANRLVETTPCTLQLSPWVTDFVCEKLHEPENEHNSLSFRRRERARNINVSIKAMSISEVLRRVRFVEECSLRIHTGISRLDRWEQRALCHYIYNNTQPHRMAKTKNTNAFSDSWVGLKRNGSNSSLKAARPAAQIPVQASPGKPAGESKGVGSRLLKQLETELPRCWSTGDDVGAVKIGRPRRSSGLGKILEDSVNSFGGKYRYHLSEMDCSGLTISLLERVIWACPTNEGEFHSLVQSFELSRSPIVPALLELINDFLSLKQISLDHAFDEVIRLNKSAEVVKPPPSVNKADSAESKSHGADRNGNEDESHLPLHCALCPQMVQNYQKRREPKYTQEEFNKLNPTFPLTVSQFIFAINVAYDRCGGRPALEGCTPAQFAVDGTDGTHQTMYGRVNENLVQEVVERTTMSSCDIFSDLGCGVGQTCLQVSATTGCKSIGYEIVHERCNAAILLLMMFDEVLAESGAAPSGTMHNLVTFLEDDFIKDERVTSQSTVIFFNNFSKWFDADIPGVGKDYNREICTQLLRMKLNAHVITLTELIGAKLWLPRKVFIAPVNSNSWQVSEDKRIPIYHYTKDSESWRCRICRVLTPNDRTMQCLNGHVPRVIRQTEGNDSCSSIGEESSSSSDSSSDSDTSSDDGSEVAGTDGSHIRKNTNNDGEHETVMTAERRKFRNAREKLEYRRKVYGEYRKLLQEGYGINAHSEEDRRHIRAYNVKRRTRRSKSPTCGQVRARTTPTTIAVKNTVETSRTAQHLEELLILSDSDIENITISSVESAMESACESTADDVVENLENCAVRTQLWRK